MVIAKTQSGKTGSMCATIKQYLENDNNLIPLENIYIITGLSSCEWKEQTKERMPIKIQSRVFHRSELPITFVDEIKNKKNIFIIMDEIHVAAKKDQTIYNTLEKAGLLDKFELYKNDVKILEYTATPDGTLYDLMKWNNASAKILADVGIGYIGANDLLSQKRIKQYKNLYGRVVDENYDEILNNIKEIKYDIDKYTKPLYHIIRTKNGTEQVQTINNFQKIFKKTDYKFVKYDKDNNMVINNILIIRPEKHTFIFIKEMLRCAKTLKKEFIGILYERYSKNPDDATIIQGLVGRNTGYDVNELSICYTNIDSIIKYDKLWKSEFKDEKIKWNSKTTKYINGKCIGKNTFNNTDNILGFSSCSDSELSEDRCEPIIKKFNSQKELIIFCKEELQKEGPRTIMPNENGYYVATIRGVENIYSYDNIYSERKQGLSSKTNNYRSYPCYKNIKDKSTLIWVLIFYDV